MNQTHWQNILSQHPQLRASLTPRLNKYIPITPSPVQTVALLLNGVPELMYGGAAGGGKTDFLLMAALQYVDLPNYNALLIRRTFGQLQMADSILSRAHLWLRNTDAVWEAKDKRYTFPSGATLTFGYLHKEADKFRYDGPSFQFVGIDEMTQLLQSQALFLAGRLRQGVGSPIPLRFRGCTNPGNVGHLWCKQRYILTQDPDRIFIPAKLEDNPHVDIASYEKSLNMLDPVTRMQRRHGDWDASIEGAMFKREWFKFVDAVPLTGQTARGWDTAATQGAGDFSAGVKVTAVPGTGWYITDVVHGQLSPKNLKDLLRNTAQLDGKKVTQVLEQEPGSSGKIVAHDFRMLLAGYPVAIYPSTKNKVQRAMPFASQAEGGNIYILNEAWTNSYFDELCAFPAVEKDDRVDATTQAFNHLTQNKRPAFGVSRVGAQQ